MSDDDGYCVFCQTNRFTDFAKHLRTNLHKINFDRIVKLQRKKLLSARTTVKQPNVMAVVELNSATTEKKSSNFWCYICCDEFAKHWVADDGDLLVENGGLAAHFSTDSHRRRIVYVRKRYRIQMDVEKFVLTKTELREFVERVEERCNQFLADRNSSLQQSAIKFNELDSLRKKLVEETSRNDTESSSSYTLYDVHPNEDDCELKNSSLAIPEFNHRMRKRFKQAARLKK